MDDLTVTASDGVPAIFENRADAPERFVEAVAPVASRVTVRPLNRVPFRSELRAVRLPRLGLFSVHVTPAEVEDDRRGYWSLTVPCTSWIVLGDDERSKYTAGDAHLLHPDEPLYLRSAAGSTMLVANLDRMSLTRAAAMMVHDDIDLSRLRGRLDLSAAAGASLGRYLRFLWHDVSSGGLLRSGLATRQAEDVLAALLLHAGLAADPIDQRLKSHDVVGKVEDYLDAHLRDDVTVAQLATIAGVSARTLFRTFRRKHGMGPMAFLRLRRLRAVHEILVESEPGDVTIHELATRHGFYHLGRLAAAYRREFGETPSETLTSRRRRSTSQS